MPDNYFFPYNYAEDALELCINEIQLDGETVESGKFVDIEHCAINLAGQADGWSEIAFSISVTDPNNQLPSVLPSYADVGSLSLWLVTRNKYTRMRKANLLEKSEGGWAGKLVLEHDDLSRFSDMGCYAVLAKDHAPAEGYASGKSERVAGSMQWKIYTDTISPLPGGALNSAWLDFEQSENTELNQRADCVWYLDLSDYESPKLLLNECVPGLRSALEVSKNRGKAASIRDALIHSIIQGVLNELAVFVISKNCDVDQLEDMPDWQRKMLLMLARQVDKSTERLIVERWLRIWKDGEQTQHVLRDIATSVQRHLNLFKSSKNLVKSAGGSLGDD